MPPATAEKTATLHFGVTGDFMTRHARQRVLEGAWDDAVRFLTESLDGMTADIALNVLAGQHAIVDDPDGGMTLADCDPDDPDVARYRARLRWQHAGVCRVRDRWLRIYAELPAVPRTAAAAPLREPSDQELLMMTYARADDPARDMAVTLPDPETGRRIGVLLAPAASPPLWIAHEMADAPARALAELRARRPEGLRRLKPDTKMRRQRLAQVQDRPDAPAGADPLDRLARLADAGAGAAPANDPETLERLRREIADQAERSGGWMTVAIPHADGPTLRVPTAAFLRWAASFTDAAAGLPAWTPVSPRGLKMGGDDPCHSDWVIAAGLDPADWYAPENEDLRGASYRVGGDLLEALTGRDAMVLADGGTVTGRVRHATRGMTPSADDILVLRAADARHLEQVRAAAGTVVEQGGQLAHLIQVARGERRTILRLAEARKRLPEGARVTLDVAAGTVRLDPLKPGTEP